MNELQIREYADFLRDLKTRIQIRQTQAILAVNRELIELYWEIGQMIVQRQEQAGWGDKILIQIEKI